MATQDSEDAAAKAIEVRFTERDLPHGLAKRDGYAFLRRGKKRWRTVHMQRIVDTETEEVRKQTLHAYTWEGVPGSSTTQLDEQERERWHCDDQEIFLLREFLAENLVAGDYKLVPSGSTMGSLIAQLADLSVDAQSLKSLLGQLSSAPELATALAQSDISTTVLQAAEIERRRNDLAQIRELVGRPDVTERSLHALLKNQSWIFGGQYVGEAVRKQLTTQTTLDIPLLRADGSLHIVELKRADVKPLVVTEHEVGLIVGGHVHRGVTQVQNYLRDLDENRGTILAAHKIDCRRASATLLIGSIDQQDSEVDRTDIAEAIRTYNSHQSRVTVMTYDELIANAERALSFGSTNQ